MTFVQNGLAFEAQSVQFHCDELKANRHGLKVSLGTKNWFLFRTGTLKNYVQLHSEYQGNPEFTILMSQFFLVDQTHPTYTVKSDSRTDESVL